MFRRTVKCAARVTAFFTGNQVVVFNEKLLVFQGDEIRRRLPNGSDEVFEVVDPKFYPEMSSIPANFQIDIRRKGAFPHRQGGHLSIAVSGDNARVNIGSNDSSTNFVSHSNVFADLMHTIDAQVDADQKAEFIDAVRNMERAKGTEKFVGEYQKFISLVGGHIAIVAPFLPALSKFF
ncbi:hypothetical protein [Maricaulis salignorans]|uniref:hypothetical protein n=1 Tax=Maricaulis salignorans TaxID=144026 RepID=UPI00115F8F4D|nr:hypothetical protein [Maricaulis salignorans]